MTWNRQTSDLEALMVDVLKKQRKPLSLSEVVAEIEKLNDGAFTGKTPVNSLYSIIYRREKRRIIKGEAPLFVVHKERNAAVYALHVSAKGRK